ncbi:hypothetical protein B0H34DRAFT_628755, partial [Crassisporium funariophilum]
NTIYLVEEFIDPVQEGRFVKYINNSSAKPLLMLLPNKEYVNTAYFLCFAQHVQYLKTGGIAYISDLQGSALGGGIFGEGNLNHDMFEEEHDCNKFCKYFGLEPFQKSDS